MLWIGCRLSIPTEQASVDGGSRRDDRKEHALVRCPTGRETMPLKLMFVEPINSRLGGALLTVALLQINNQLRRLPFRECVTMETNSFRRR